jgi:hypothetical protein
MEKLPFRTLSREQLKDLYGGQALFNQCGRQAGGALCPNNLCCSGYGWCGDTAEYCCSVYGGCQSGPCNTNC